MAPRRVTSVAVAAALLASLVLAGGADAAFITACTAAAISAADPGCPTGTGPCSITKDFTIPTGCTIDFGTRAVSVANGKEIHTGSGTVIFKMGSLDLKPGAIINGRGEAVVPPDDRGGFIRIETTGTVLLEKASAQGRIDVSGVNAVGAIRIFAGGTVTVNGTLRADKLGALAAGGLIFVDSTVDIVSTLGSVISAVTNGSAAVQLQAKGNINLAEQVDVTGGEGGEFDVDAGGTATVGKVIANASGETGSGGSVTIVAGTTVSLNGDVLANGNGSADGSGGCGGDIDIESLFGNLTISTKILAEGAISDGGGGFIDIESAGTLTIQSTGVVSALANGGQGCGGEIDMIAQVINCGGSLSASGGAGGGVIDVSADGALTMSGSMVATASTDTADGGEIDIEAGALGSGDLLISGTVDVTGGACDTFGFCGTGGDISAVGCNNTVTTLAHLRSRGGSGGSTTVSAREQLTVSGSGVIDATNTGAAGGPGSNVLNFPSAKPASVAVGSIVPAAVTFSRPSCTTFGFPVNCINRCGTCGNGAIEFPETCDDGNTNSCDTCSKFCQVETCSDGLPCTTDTCDPVLGCRHTGAADNTPCPDSLFCNGTETCHSGICTSASAPSCSDGLACTQDVCVEPGTCTHPPAAIGTACTDTDLCTVGSTCDGHGVCGTAVICDDGNVCTTDTCNPATGCVFTNRTGSCTDDGNVCTNDVCSAGTCTHPNNTAPCADDGNVCTNDVCAGGSCTHPAGASGGACPDDGNVCTGDVCASGVCTHPAASGPCGDDGNVCTNDVCAAGVCTHPNNTASCADDGNVCTGDVCAGGACTHPPASGPCADDGNVCTNDVCAGGACTHPNNTAPCTDDGNVCTGDVCAGGSCTHPANTAPCTDDGNVCTNDVCAGGTCTHPGTSGGACPDDGNVCTGDVCASGACTHPPASGPCADDGNVCTNDVCAGGLCTHPAGPNGVPCNDNQFCTLSDTCQGGICSGGTLRSCVDSNACTSDTCNESSDTCDHTPIVPCCGNGVPEAGEQCDDGNSNDGDGCTNACTLGTGCGDGIVQSPEECDAGSGNANTPDAVCRTDCRLPRCGDGVTDPGLNEQCDDGNATSGDGCSYRCFFEPPATAARVAGGGSASTDCSLEWAVDDVPTIDKKGQHGIKQICRDGDPSCDFGSTAQECLFHVWLCANLLDERFPLCTPDNPGTFGTVAFIEIKKPSEKDVLKRPEDGVNKAILVPVTNAVLTGQLNDCGPRMSIRVPRKSPTAKATKTLKVKGTTTRVLFDTDSVKLNCTP